MKKHFFSFDIIRDRKDDKKFSKKKYYIRKRKMSNNAKNLKQHNPAQKVRAFNSHAYSRAKKKIV
jgi:3-methyladenine DNA glycosylase AlkC